LEMDGVVRRLTEEILQTLAPLVSEDDMDDARLGVEFAIRRILESLPAQSRRAASLAK